LKKVLVVIVALILAQGCAGKIQNAESQKAAVEKETDFSQLLLEKIISGEIEGNTLIPKNETSLSSRNDLPEQIPLLHYALLQYQDPEVIQKVLLLGAEPNQLIDGSSWDSLNILHPGLAMNMLYSKMVNDDFLSSRLFQSDEDQIAEFILSPKAILEILHHHGAKGVFGVLIEFSDVLTSGDKTGIQSMVQRHSFLKDPDYYTPAYTESMLIYPLHKMILEENIPLMAYLLDLGFQPRISLPWEVLNTAGHGVVFQPWIKPVQLAILENKVESLKFLYHWDRENPGAYESFGKDKFYYKDDENLFLALQDSRLEVLNTLLDFGWL